MNGKRRSGIGSLVLFDPGVEVGREIADGFAEPHEYRSAAKAAKLVEI